MLLLVNLAEEVLWPKWLLDGCFTFASVPNAAVKLVISFFFYSENPIFDILKTLWQEIFLWI